MTIEKRVLVLLAIIALSMALPVSARSSSENGETETSKLGHLRDFFFYSCVHRFFKGESLDEIDASLPLSSEYLSYDFDTIMAVVEKAKGVVASLKALQSPEIQKSEGDYRRVTVLMTCLEESRKLTVPRQGKGK